MGPSDLAACIRALLAAPHRMHALADRSRAFARQQSFDRTARALLATMNEHKGGVLGQ
jgi:hypothetical protein